MVGHSVHFHFHFHVHEPIDVDLDSTRLDSTPRRGNLQYGLGRDGEGKKTS